MINEHHVLPCFTIETTTLAVGSFYLFYGKHAVPLPYVDF